MKNFSEGASDTVDETQEPSKGIHDLGQNLPPLVVVMKKLPALSSIAGSFLAKVSSTAGLVSPVPFDKATEVHSPFMAVSSIANERGLQQKDLPSSHTRCPLHPASPVLALWIKMAPLDVAVPSPVEHETVPPEASVERPLSRDTRLPTPDVPLPAMTAVTGACRSGA